MEQLSIFDYVVQKAPEKVPPQSRGLSPFVIDFLSNFQSRTLRTLRTMAADLPNDWHYSEMELPTEPGIYFCVSPLSDSKYYNFRYLAWAHKHWWVNVRIDRVKWYLLDEDDIRMRSSIPFAWMEIPDKYQREDETLHRMYADFVTEADWRHERLMKAIEQHRQHYYSSDDKLIVIDEDERFKG